MALGTVPDSLAPAAPAAPKPTVVEAAKESASIDVGAAFQEAKRRVVDAFERDYLTASLKAAGSISKAARVANVERSYFKRLLKKHGLGGAGDDS